MKHDHLRRVSLPYVLSTLYWAFPNLVQVHLFGSRRFETGSIRSDIDLLLQFNGSVALPVLGSTAYETEPYVDAFVVQGSSAVSAINGSVVRSPNDSLVADLGVELIWRDGSWVGRDAFDEHDVLNWADPIPTMLSGGAPRKTITVPPVCDYLIVTALQEEYEAARAAIGDLRTARPTLAPPFSLGEVTLASGGTAAVAVTVLPRMGMVSAALTTRRMLDYVSPRLVVLVGIAGGISRDEVQLGDIVLPGEIYEYEAVKVTPAGERHNSLICPVAADPYASIKMWDASAWLKQLSASMPGGGREPRIIFDGAMASGQKVIADSERATALTLVARRTSSIDMESFGVAEACRQSPVTSPFIVVKSISDYADDEKDDDWHPFCCAASAALAIELVREQVI